MNAFTDINEDSFPPTLIADPPSLQQRAEQPYVAVAHSVPMDGFDDVIDPSLAKVEQWLAKHKIAITGPPLLRYRAIDMEHELDIEVGWPVESQPEAAAGMVVDSLPAGTYARLIYRNPDDGVDGNRYLIEWAGANGIAWDRWDSDRGDTFASRVEYMRSDPAKNPDSTTHEFEVAILIKE